MAALKASNAGCRSLSSSCRVVGRGGSVSSAGAVTAARRRLLCAGGRLGRSSVAVAAGRHVPTNSPQEPQQQPRSTTAAAAAATATATATGGSDGAGSKTTTTNAAAARAGRGRGDNDNLLLLISASVETDASVARFETLAGRSAMMGLAAAAAIELLTDHALVSTLTAGQAEAVAAGALAAVGGAAAAAALASSRAFRGGDGLAWPKAQQQAQQQQAQQQQQQQRRQLPGAELLEAVVSSLTAAQRAAAGVSGFTGVDRAVDAVLANAFSAGVVAALLGGDSDGDGAAPAADAVEAEELVQADDE